MMSTISENKQQFLANIAEQIKECLFCGRVWLPNRPDVKYCICTRKIGDKPKYKKRKGSNKQ